MTETYYVKEAIEGIVSTYAVSIQAKDSTISTQSTTIAADASTLTVREDTISTQSTTIAADASTLTVREDTISTQSATIAADASTLSVRDDTISTQSTTIASDASTLSVRDDTISTQSTTIASDASTLSVREDTISTQSTMIAADKAVMQQGCGFAFDTLMNDVVSMTAVYNANFLIDNISFPFDTPEHFCDSSNFSTDVMAALTIINDHVNGYGNAVSISNDSISTLCVTIIGEEGNDENITTDISDFSTAYNHCDAYYS